jgi:hypothetical protein
MQKHLDGNLSYRELPQEAGRDFGMPEQLVRHEHRHTSILIVSDGSTERLVAIDNEDSFVHMQPFIEDVDVYFCCPFNTAFHREQRFPDLLPWQTEEDVDEYRTQADLLIERFGEHFDKVEKLTPTPTSLANFGRMDRDEWKRAVWKHRFRKLAVWRDDRELWRHDYAACESRYDQMVSYRDLSLRYDVICRESLWGWPDNRIELHKRLQTLRDDGYDVYSQLTPISDTEAVHPDSRVSEENRSRLEDLMEPIALDEPYETAFASSRLTVFPTGFHWGWRGITFLALCAGLPILMDRPIYEPYFDFDAFDVWYNEGTWEKTRRLLDEIDEDEWHSIKARNQSTFDRFLSPSSVGSYLQQSFSDLVHDPALA